MQQASLPLFAQEPEAEPAPKVKPQACSSSSPGIEAPRPAVITPKPQPLWLCLHFPILALEALSLGPDEAVAVVEDVAGRCLVYIASTLASDAGVTVGMPLNAALALCPDLKIERRQPLQEQALLASLAAWAADFSSVVTLDGSAVLLEVRGSLKLFGGLRALHQQITEGLTTQGHRFSVAAAPTLVAAKLLAQYSGGQVVARRESLRTVLGDLPIACLPLEPKRLQRLAKIGAKCLNDLWRLPRDGLARRFGPDLLHFLDQALGVQADPRQVVEKLLRFEADIELYRETDNSAFILSAAEELFDGLIDFLHQHDAGVSRFHIKLFHPQRCASDLVVGLRQVSRDSERFSALLEEHLNHFLLPAPVVSVAIVADEVLPYRAEKTSLFNDAGVVDSEWESVLEDLQSRLGEHAVRSLACEDDHRPEQAWSHEVKTSGDGQSHGGKRRPGWLLPQPELLDRCRVELLQGPERIEAGWWAGGDVRRDYFQARAGDGARLWVFRDLTSGKWYLHGLFA